MTPVNVKRLIILSFSLLPRIGPSTIKKLAQKINTFLDANTNIEVVSVLSLLCGFLGKSYSSDDIQSALALAENILLECRNNGISQLSILEVGYPRKLMALKDPPPLIYYLGNLEVLKSEVVTIIGTRKPTNKGAMIAFQVGQYFSSKDYAVCNGLAEGVDTHVIYSDSHGPLPKVIGVVPSGLSAEALQTLKNNTKENFDRVVQNNGLIVSEYPPSKSQDIYSVVNSCRIQAGISSGVILIQSGINGGSRFAIKAALETKRPIGVIQPVPSEYENQENSGNRLLIENGVEGLSTFLKVEHEKTLSSYSPKIITLKNKLSYPDFESELKPQFI